MLKGFKIHSNLNYFQNDRRPQEEIRTGFFDDRRRTPQNRDERQQDYQDYLADVSHEKICKER